jgi:hypothetical protein
MSELTVRRLSATVHGSEEHRGRVDTLLRRMADRRLEASLAHEGLPDGEWCIRRVDLTVTLDDEADGIVEDVWADAILSSLRRAIADGSSGVVVFPDLHHAIVDLALGVAAGDLASMWAWRLAGALQDGDPDPTSDPSGALLAACARLPRAAVVALVRAVQATDPGGVQRLLGVEGLTQLVIIVSGLHGVSGLLDRVGDFLADDSPGADADLAGRYVGPKAAGHRATCLDRARRLVRASVLARAVASSGLRVTPVLAARWALLAVAESDPFALGGDDAAHYVAAVAELLVQRDKERPAGLRRPSTSPHAEAASETIRAAGSPPDKPGEQRATAPVFPRLGAAIAPERAPAELGPPVHATAEPRAPGAARAGSAEAIAQVEREAATDWGGLLFMLNTAADAGFPERLGDPRLAARPLPWTLQQLARRLVPASRDDPAVLAFAGLRDRPSSPDDPVSPDELAAVEDVALMWAAATARRLAAVERCALPGDPYSAVTAVALRPAVITGDPGWLEIRLFLKDIDLEVRKAGLDVDPGWVDWLGTVVRFRYV